MSWQMSIFQKQRKNRFVWSQSNFPRAGPEGCGNISFLNKLLLAKCSIPLNGPIGGHTSTVSMTSCPSWKKNNTTSQGTRALIKEKIKLENHLADFHLKVPPPRFGYWIKKKQTRIQVDPAENEQREFHESVKYVLALSYSKTQTNFPVLWQTRIFSHW